MQSGCLTTRIEAIDAVFNARSIAVVGASADESKFGGMTMKSLLAGGYEGRLYPVNPKGGDIMGLQAYRSVNDVPGRLDGVIIVVPAGFVAEILEQSARKGARGAVIQSAGFRESGRFDLEEEIAATARRTGVRLMGPNIQGINYLPNKLCAMFFPVIDLKGPLAVVTQSGTVTTALSEWAAGEGLGISAAVNLGNQADICEADYIDYFINDPGTKAIVLYVESFKNGRRFLQSLGHAALKKPVAVMKAGRTATGERATASHTGAVASSHPVFAAACRQFGAVSADDLTALYDKAKALALLGPPAGRRVVVISTSGGAAALAADEGERLGLSFPSLPRLVKAELAALKLPPLAQLENPIDLVSLDAEHFLRVAQIVDRSNVADMILFSFGDPVSGAAQAAARLKNEISCRLAVSYMGGGAAETEGRFAMQRAGIPVYPAPERAMRAIAAAVWKAEYVRRRYSNG